jgi:hypothetical protein
VTLVEVQGAGHSLTTPVQRPSPEELAATVTAFFVAGLKLPALSAFCFLRVFAVQ